jgi:hypothetical protein
MNKFNYRGFGPEKEIVLNAECMLKQLVNLSSELVSTVLDTSALLAFTNQTYTCAIELRTAHISFVESVAANEPIEAINLIDQKLRLQMIHWRKSKASENLEGGVSDYETPDVSSFEKQELGF